MNRDLWHEIAVVLGRNKLRTFLTGFGVFWGIFMLVIMLGSGNGLKNGTTAGFAGNATNSMFMWTMPTSKAYKGFKAGRRINFRNADIPAIQEGVPNLDVISPRAQAGGHRGASNVTRGVKTGAFSISGDYPQMVKIQPVKILQGRYINDNDIAEKRKVCIIGIEVYNALYMPGEEVLGSYIKAQGINYKVVGLFSAVSSDANRSEQQEKTIIIPLTTFQRAYAYGDIIGWISFTSKPGVPVSEVGEDIKTILKQRHKIHPEDAMAFGSYNLEKTYNQLISLFTGINLLSLIVGTLTLLAGAIGVSNIMLVIVKERTKEFGIRRAIGASPWMVMQQVLLESIVLTLAAGILGIIAGVWALELLSYAMANISTEAGYFRNPGVNLPTILGALVILVIAGIVAGIIPSRKAVQVKPVEALHYE